MFVLLMKGFTKYAAKIASACFIYIYIYIYIYSKFHKDQFRHSEVVMAVHTYIKIIFYYY
jgi:hypothetical protein